MPLPWIEPPPCHAPSAWRLAHELRLPRALAEILVRRQPDPAAFLEARLGSLRPPEELPGAAEAAAALDAAIALGNRIVLYGDYDVDGVASLAMLNRMLGALGATTECFLPSRHEEGYGLSAAGVERCWRELRPEVLIAVDCGTNSAEEIRRLQSLGVEVIVLDHHEPSGPPPPCPIVNPKLSGKFHELCAAGVAFKVLHALLKRRQPPRPDLREVLDLAALATVADMVPLVGENRPLARWGLLQIARTRWPGLAALARLASLPATPRGSDIGFRLGPRINAAGRLETAATSLRLLLADDPSEAAKLAQQLDRQNRERQKIEQAVCEEAEAWIETRLDPASLTVVTGARGWHQGVLGIVAARLMRKLHRPAIVVGFDEDGRGHGSGRSPGNFSLVEALGRCADLLLTFGGHNAAAGLTLDEANFEAFRRRFEQVAVEAGGATLFTPALALDADLDLGDLNEEFLDAQERLEPFGMGHPQPVFRARTVRPEGAPRLLKDKHLAWEFRAGRRRLRAIFFEAASLDLPRPPWDVAFRVERDTWGGLSEPRLHIVAVRPAA